MSKTDTHPRSSAAVLDATRAQGRAALIAYVPVGFPDVPTSIAAMHAAADAGADLIEVGLPYSDPLMDGPVIQKAVEQALRSGVRTRDSLTAVSHLSAADIPAVVMTYWNLVDRYGVTAFARDLANAGGSGVITPDLIVDEAGPWVAASTGVGVERIFLVAPSSSDARISATVAQSNGWVYAASTMGVTGARSQVSSGAPHLVARTRAAGAPRVCVGLGVSNPRQATEVAAYADGVIVGTAFVHALASASSTNAGVTAVGELAAALRTGIDAAG